MANQTDSLLSQKSSDSGLHIQLHPLVLLTISDHITRHVRRGQKGPILGALLGQQHGREITVEHGFECLVVEEDSNGEIQMPNEWFVDRVKQYKDVHKVPALDLVGWWSTSPPSGPTKAHLPIHRQILQSHNESAIFLAFHPTQAQKDSSGRSKLPVSIYESVYEGESATDGGKAMQVDGEEQSLNIRFREIPYTVETGEAEMIGIDTVARTARNAAVIDHSATATSTSTDPTKQQENLAPTTDLLSPEDEELIASLNTRVNAIRTLQSRISLLKSYVSGISPSSENPQGELSAQLNHSVLRDINSLLSNLSLLTPHENSAFAAEALAQNNDVNLVALLGQLSQSISDIKDVGKRTAIVANSRRTAAARKGQGIPSRYEDDIMAGAGIAP
ncbi:hypothetical protein BJX68DRAFT_264541 [Aspergillus pseudodeflectus]|uniref:COP9 signalosome complex subunit 6 n=1 Tax=Aspergillus pseudodeflectus TaxID=176178 RepID=A0ABR4KRI4_9EURO